MANRHIDPRMLSSYIDGELKDRQKHTVEEHLEGCAECRAQLEELKAVSVRLQSWQAPEPSWDFDNRVRHRIIASDVEGGRVKMKNSRWVLIPSGVVAGLLVLLLVVGTFTQRGIQGRLREARDGIGEQFSPGSYRTAYDASDVKGYKAAWGAKRYAAVSDKTLEYEPYYDASTYTVREEVGKEARLELGGGVVRDAADGSAMRRASTADGFAMAKLTQQAWKDPADVPVADFKAGEAPGGAVIVIAPTLPATGEGEKIIRTATVRIEVENGQDVYVKLTEVCQESGGYLAGSYLNADEDGRISGAITMRIPQDKFLEVLDKVRELGDVKQFVTDSRDVSRDYRNLSERLDAAMVVYEKMLKALQNRRNTIEDAIRSESELTPVLARIQGLKDRIEALENAVSYTTITVAFGEPEVSERLVAASGQHIQRALMAAKIGLIKSFAKALPNLGGIILTILLVLGGGVLIARLVAAKKNKVE